MGAPYKDWLLHRRRARRRLVVAAAIALLLPGAGAAPANVLPPEYAADLQAGVALVSSSPKDALAQFEAAERVLRASGPSESDELADVSYLQAIALNLAGRQSDAVDRERRAIAMETDLHGDRDRRTSLARKRLGDLYAFNRHWKLAYETYAPVGSLIDAYTDAADAKSDAEFDVAYAEALTNTSRFDEAEDRLTAALRLRAKAFGKLTPEVGEAFERDGELEAERGHYRTALSRFATVEKLEEKLGATDTALLARTAVGAGKAFHAIGRFGDAEPPLRFAIAYGKTHREVRYVKDGAAELSLLLIDEGRYDEGVDVLIQSLGKDAPPPKVSGGPVDTSTVSAERQLADSANNAERVLADFGPETLAYARASENLAGASLRADHTDGAREALEKAVSIVTRVAGTNHPLLADALRSRADLDRATGDLDAAVRDDTAALAVYDRAGGTALPRAIETRTELAKTDVAQKRFDDARSLLVDATDETLKNLQTGSTFASENDRVAYLQLVGTYAYDALVNLCWDRCAGDPGLAQHVLDATLQIHGGVTRDVRVLRARVALAGKDALASFDRWRGLRSRIAALRFAGDFGRTSTQREIRDLTQEANARESALVRASAGFAANISGKPPGWRDVASRLGPSDAAVLVDRVPGGKDMPYRYLAFVVRRSGVPAAIPLTDENVLEGKALDSYRALEDADERSPAAPKFDAALYDAIWKPLEPALAGAKRIFVAPDGDLTQINLAVMPDESGRLLFETRDVRIVSDLSDLVYAGPVRPAGARTALLIGDPDFAASLPGSPVADAAEAGARSVNLREVKTALVSPLPGTRREVGDIAGLLRARNWNVTTLLGDGATKAAVARTRAERVIHFATHGFFLEPPTERTLGSAFSNDDPMLRSGLLLAGATESLRRDDASAAGILTAFEASTLKLDGTELVVLSACDTGLGTVELGAGVFGLRRAFHDAGAANVMMSMWSVPDRETHELMKAFYGYWLGGAEMHAALAHAMREERAVVKKRYGKDLPRMWGAFVIDG